MKNFYLRFSNVPSGFVYIIPVQAGGGAEHSGNCTQRSYPLVLEAESDQLCVPAFKCRLWISWWRPAKPRTGMSFSNIFKPNFNLRTSFWCSTPVRFSQSVREVNFASNQGYGEVPFWLLLNSSLLFNSILSGITGLFFARKIHSTSELAMNVLSKCVMPGNAFLSKMWMQRPDVWIYTFILVVHLSKVKQSFNFQLLTNLSSECWNSLLPYLASPFCLNLKGW